MQLQLDDLDSETYRCDMCGNPCYHTTCHTPVSPEIPLTNAPKDCPAHPGNETNWKLISKVRQEGK